MGSAPSTRATRSRLRVRPGSTARREVPGATEGRVRMDFGEQQETLPAERRRSSARSTVVHMVPEQPAWPRRTRKADSHQGQAPLTLNLEQYAARTVAHLVPEESRGEVQRSTIAPDPTQDRGHESQPLAEPDVPLTPTLSSDGWDTPMTVTRG